MPAPKKKPTKKAPASKKKTSPKQKAEAPEETLEEVSAEASDDSAQERLQYPLPPREGTVGEADFAETMGTNFMVYAKSVLVGRAIPSIDGLKPVQRRILLAMNDLRLRPDSRYSKCAKVVGSTLGSYHPHGDASVYGALVNMAQDFTMRIPLIDGHGSFGSIDGDGAAAMRYTEARLQQAAMELLADLDPQILPDHYGRNFDESMLEPHLLPARFPNLLINGGTGIAVGMATTILPHNPKEIVDLCVWRAQNPKAKDEQLVKRVSGPDFPTGATIIEDEGLRQSYLTGKGKVTAIAKAHVEQLQGNKEKIVVTEIPWGVNKGDLLIKIAKQCADGKFPEITELNDLSKGDHELRIEATLKWGANSRAVMQRLLTSTGLRKVYGVEMNVLVEGRPETLSLTRIVDLFLEFRRTVIKNRAKKRIGEIEERLHKLAAYTAVVDNTDKVVQTIKKAKDRASAKPPLKKLLKIDDQQAQWIVEMQLGQLTQLDRSKLLEEIKVLEEELAELKALIASGEKINNLMIEEFKSLLAVWKKQGVLERKTTLAEAGGDESDLTSMTAPAEDCLLLLSRDGRGLCGQGTLRRGASLNLGSGEPLAVVEEASTDQEWVVFSRQGKAYRLRLAELPLEQKRSRGADVRGAISLDKDEEILAARPLDKEEEGHLVMVSSRGIVKKIKASDLKSVHSGGMAVAKLQEGDRLIYIAPVKEGDSIVLLASNGKALRFEADAIRVMGRTAAGVRGIKIPDGEEVVGAVVIGSEEEQVFYATDGGFAKRVPASEIPLKGRGTGGVQTMRVGGKYGSPIYASHSKKGDELWVDAGGGRLKPYPLSRVAQGKRSTMPKRWPGEKGVGAFLRPADGKG